MNKSPSVCSIAFLLITVLGPLSAMAADAPYAPPASPRQTINFNPAWKFIRQDVPGAETRASTIRAGPRSARPTRSTTSIRSARSSPIAAATAARSKGVVWYRKHFKLPAELPGDKLFLEFEGMRQAGDLLPQRQGGRALRERHDRLRRRHLRRRPLRRRRERPGRASGQPHHVSRARQRPGLPTGTPTTSIPTTAASTATSGCTSPARSTRRCRCITACRARASTSMPRISTCRPRPPMWAWSRR